MFFASAAGAQVYKCETADGLVFTDRPCEGAELLALESDSAGLGRDRLRLLETQIALEEKKLQRERQRYWNVIRKRRNQELAAIDSQIAELERDRARANNNLAGATYAAGIDSRIAALHESQARLQASREDQIVRAELEAMR